MDGTRDSSKVKSETYRQIPCHITYIWNLIYGRMNLSTHTKKKFMDMENRLMVAEGEGEGVRWTGSLGLVDVNYCIWSG